MFDEPLQRRLVFITFNTLLMQILKGSHTFDLCIIKIVFFGLSTESMDLWIRPLRTYVRSYVPIFPKIRALEFSDFLVLKNKKMSKKVTFSLFHRKFENGPFLAKNGPKSAFLAQNAQEWGF